MDLPYFADLHNHSIFSDGEYTPEQLVLKAKNIGLKALSLTDHDTIKGIKETLDAGRKHGITIIPGVEASIRFDHPFFTGTLHILLYFSQTLLNNMEFCKEVERTLGMGRGEELVRKRVNKINKEFGPEGNTPFLPRNLLAEEILSIAANPSRRHFAIALQENFKITHREKINMLIGNDSPSYLPSGISLNELAPLYKKYPMVAVLAHPAAGSFPGKSHYREVLPPVETVGALLPELLDPEVIGIDGLEIYYPGHTESLRTTLFGWAEKHSLIITGGSDCHDASERPLGITGVSEHELTILQDKIESK